MTRVLIADDHAIVRRGLERIIQDEVGGWEVGEAATADDVLRQVREAVWDVMVLDISLPDRNGLDLLIEIKALRPALPVLILSMHAESQYAMRALKCGAAGYVSKESASAELVDALKRVLNGGKYVSAAVAETLADVALGLSSSTPHEGLSNREFTVLVGLGQGKAVGELAAELGLSVKTVSTYRSRMLEKMAMRTNADVVRYVIDHGLE
ncbi:MAG: response regulator transcription factor [Ardenticatenales bacterium]|nr:response regulator transcription factor [Ardenticatenales bacterium]